MPGGNDKGEANIVQRLFAYYVVSLLIVDSGVVLSLWIAGTSLRRLSNEEVWPVTETIVGLPAIPALLLLFPATRRFFVAIGALIGNLFKGCAVVTLFLLFWGVVIFIVLGVIGVLVFGLKQIF